MVSGPLKRQDECSPKSARPIAVDGQELATTDGNKAREKEPGA